MSDRKEKSLKKGSALFKYWPLYILVNNAGITCKSELTLIAVKIRLYLSKTLSGGVFFMIFTSEMLTGKLTKFGGFVLQTGSLPNCGGFVLQTGSFPKD